MRLGLGLVVGLVALSGCEDVIDLDPIDRRAPVEASVRPKPISGGTLVVTSDGMAVAADPDRDLVHVVDLAAEHVLHTLALSPGDEPGRVVQGSGSLVHVVLRGSGGIATLDIAEGAVLAQQALCPDPRGIAFDPYPAVLHVACADGTLVSLAEASLAEIDRVRLEPDLRDVMVVDGTVWASRFRSASLVNAEHRQTALAPVDDFTANVAWRTWAEPDGRIMMLHQLSATRPVPIMPPPAKEGDRDELPYGGGGGFCEPGITNTALTTITEGESFTTLIPDASLTVDAAVSPLGEWMALAMPGVEEGTGSVGLMIQGENGCFLIANERGDEQVTAVAFDASGMLVMQSREPARLVLQSSLPSGDLTVIELEGDARYDTGHEIFHRATESGLSCASCHPEGTDDGHVWVFEGLGKRRTQPLDIGLADTAPFHWDGEMNDLDVLVEEVLAHRMGGKRQSPARGESFARWLFAQQRPPAGTSMDDPALVQQGEALFTTHGCDRCHTGALLGGTTTEPIRGTELQVPSLRRVSLHPPFMHDGRSPTLHDAVRDMIETTTSTEAAAQDIEALTAYMRTL
jgi:mono/diheme cytochrome c family protein